MNLLFDIYACPDIMVTSKSLSKITFVTSTQSRIHCAVILSISLALGCKINSGADKIASAWNNGTFARTAALKACKFLEKEKNHIKDHNN